MIDDFKTLNYLSSGEHSLEEVLKLAGVETESVCPTCEKLDLSDLTSDYECPECGATYGLEKTRPDF